jgi:hypothetical protein
MIHAIFLQSISDICTPVGLLCFDPWVWNPAFWGADLPSEPINRHTVTYMTALCHKENVRLRLQNFIPSAYQFRPFKCLFCVDPKFASVVPSYSFGCNIYKTRMQGWTASPAAYSQNNILEPRDLISLLSRGD